MPATATEAASRRLVNFAMGESSLLIDARYEDPDRGDQRPRIPHPFNAPDGASAHLRFDRTGVTVD